MLEVRDRLLVVPLDAEIVETPGAVLFARVHAIEMLQRLFVMRLCLVVELQVRVDGRHVHVGAPEARILLHRSLECLQRLARLARGVQLLTARVRAHRFHGDSRKGFSIRCA